MRTFFLFNKPVGTRVTLQTTPDSNIVEYGAVLVRIPGGVVTRWQPSQLQGAGGTEVLGPAQGHNVVVFPIIRPNTTPVMQTTLSFSDGSIRQENITLIDNTAFGWRIFMS